MMTRKIRHIASIISPYNRGENTLLALLANLKEAKKSTPIPVMFNAIKRLAPGLKVLPQIRAGRTIYLPAYLTEKSSTYYAMRWCLKKEGVNLKTPLAQRLSSSMLETLQKFGHAYTQKKDLINSVLQSRVNVKPPFRRFKKQFKKGKLVKPLKPVKQFKRKNLKLKPKVKTPRNQRLNYLSDMIPNTIRAFAKKKRKKTEIIPNRNNKYIPKIKGSRVPDKKNVELASGKRKKISSSTGNSANLLLQALTAKKRKINNLTKIYKR